MIAYDSLTEGEPDSEKQQQMMQMMRCGQRKRDRREDTWWLVCTDEPAPKKIDQWRQKPDWKAFLLFKLLTDFHVIISISISTYKLIETFIHCSLCVTKSCIIILEPWVHILLTEWANHHNYGVHPKGLALPLGACGRYTMTKRKHVLHFCCPTKIEKSGRWYKLGLLLKPPILRSRLFSSVCIPNALLRITSGTPKICLVHEEEHFWMNHVD